MKILKGIMKTGEITAAISQKQNITASLYQGNSRPDVERYDGKYEATPKVTAQVVPTKNKLMQDDFTVKEIPYFEVTNTANGKTVTIGNEV